MGYLTNQEISDVVAELQELDPESDRDAVMDKLSEIARGLGMVPEDEMDDWAYDNGYLSGESLDTWATEAGYVPGDEVEFRQLDSTKAHLEATKRQDPGKWEYQYLPMLKELIGEQA